MAYKTWSRRIFLLIPLMLIFLNESFAQHKVNSSDSDLQKGIALLDTSLQRYFTTEDLVMHRFYNPFTTERSKEKGSVWMYTSAIEAVNLTLKSLKEAGKQNTRQYNEYLQRLSNLYDKSAFYLGTFTLTSYTQTKEWSVYAVDRVDERGKARVIGIYNVYDDQMWFIRELIESYHITHNPSYLEQAEYLTEYVLDGWDATRDSEGKEHGGIPWGPGYVTKHACSNGPMVSPLVWLHDIYKRKKDKIVHRYIDPKDGKTRKSKMVYKRDYYLDFARKIYQWQKKNLLNAEGVYDDMMGECYPDCKINYEEVGGVRYRAHTSLRSPMGRAYTYNSGTMLSGAVDLYTATQQKEYLKDAKALAKATFKFFAKKDEQIEGQYRLPYDGFNNWFNTVLLRGYVALLPYEKQVKNYIWAFKDNLDYANQHYNKEGVLPQDLLKGWHLDPAKNQVEGMFMFSFVSQHALFQQTLHLLTK